MAFGGELAGRWRHGEPMKRGEHRIIVGDCLSEMAKLPAGTFHACMTSPPYFALRSYLPAGHPDKEREIGSEPTPEAFIATMAAVFREVRRVLRDDGFLWINLGDSYDAGGRQTNGTRDGYKQGTNAGTEGNMRSNGGVGAGQQLLMPHRVALALQADGWVLRDTVIWSKRSPMPSSQNGVRWERCRVKVESTRRSLQPHNAATGKRDGGPGGVGLSGLPSTTWCPCPGCPKCIPTGGYVFRRGQGRTTTAHEYLFLFTKGNGYFWDMENTREPCSSTSHGGPNVVPGEKNATLGQGTGNLGKWTADDKASGRIPRSVWTISSEPTKFNHFATYPSELVRRCLMPLSPKGCCPACGAQWAPVVETERVKTRPGIESKIGTEQTESGYVVKDSQEVGNRDPWRHITSTKVIGYRPTCKCPAAEPVPCRVCDIFSGTGTTGQTACFLGHDYVGIELNPEYAAFSDEWIGREPRWSKRQRIKAARKAVKPCNGQLQLTGF